jgi:hypothetical protein
VSWSAHLQHTETGLAIVFAGPVSRLDLTPDVAEHFASLIAIEARHRLAGVVRTLEAKKTLCIRSADVHPIFCTCDPCLNGDHDG